MSKYFGNIGFAIQEEVRPGIWEERIEEHPYYGDVLSNSRRWGRSDQINPNLTLNNSFSVITDAYFIDHFPTMCYLVYQGIKFEIVSIDLERPRAIISVGGVYVERSTSTDSSESIGDDSGE